MYNSIVYIFAAFYQMVNYKRDWKSWLFFLTEQMKKVFFFLKILFFSRSCCEPQIVVIIPEAYRVICFTLGKCFGNIHYKSDRQTLCKIMTFMSPANQKAKKDLSYLVKLRKPRRISCSLFSAICTCSQPSYAVICMTCTYSHYIYFLFIRTCLIQITKYNILCKSRNDSRIF